MKKLLFALLITILPTIIFFCQIPDTLWSRSYGGSNDEWVKSIIETSDGGFAIAGYTLSTDGDVHNPLGNRDFWIVKINRYGDTLWTKSYGGTAADEAYCILELPGNDLIVVGETNSSSHDVQRNYGMRDVWVLRLTSEGDTVWTRNYGGSLSDFGRDAVITFDNNVVIVGGTRSSDFDLSDNVGYNGWAFKIDLFGNIIWSETDGYNTNGFGQAIIQTQDSGFLAAGIANNYESWLIKMDKEGKEEWKKLYKDYDNNTVYDVIQIEDGFIGAGYKENWHGNTSRDGWIFRVDSVGNIIWDRLLVGDKWEEFTSIINYEDTCILVSGFTKSSEFVSYSSYDSWILKFNLSGDSIWSKTIGGSLGDKFYSIKNTSDSGFIAAGYSHSSDGYLHRNNGKDDFWLVRFAGDFCSSPTDLVTSNLSSTSAELSWTENGTATTWEIMLDTVGFDTTGVVPITVNENPYTCQELKPGTEYDWYIRSICGEDLYSEWTGLSIFRTLRKGLLMSKTYGGSLYESAESIHQTLDKGYIVAGSTQSNDGDVLGNHGSRDFWVIKIDESGDTIWTRTYGGTNWDKAYAVQEVPSDGFIVVGVTNSNDGDVTGNHGSLDAWVVKLDDLGKIEWSKTLGGSNVDAVYSVRHTIDGGYILAGNTSSFNGDVTGNHGLSDCWVVKLDKYGSIEWTEALGGSGFDVARCIELTSDEGYIVSGAVNSNDGDVFGKHEKSDVWVVKLSGSGEIEWSKTIGGSGHESANAVHQISDGGYIVAAITDSNDGDVFANHGENDYWLIKLDNNGEVILSETYGGTSMDFAYCITQTPKGHIIMAGSTWSDNGNIYGNHGGVDCWIVKLNLNGEILSTHTLGGSYFDEALSIEPTVDGGYVIAGQSRSNDGDVYGVHGEFDFWVVKLSTEDIYMTGLFIENTKLYGTSGNTDVSLGDMDNDGDLDAVVTKDGEGEPNKAWLNDGDGNFTDSGLSFGNAKSWGIALGDLDDDGDLDGFVANDGPNKVYLNAGANTTDNGQSLGNLSSHDVVLADMDGDGDLDAVVANNATGQPNKVWLNNGNAIFFDSGLSLGNGSSYSLAPGDLDADGDLDGFVANDGANKVYLNNGAYTSDNGQNLGSASSMGIELGDMDSDGDLDAVIANNRSGEPNTVWLNNGAASFTNSGLSFGTNVSLDVALGDLDGDNDMDGFIANEGSNRVYLNDGVNTAHNGQSLGNSNSYGVALGDLDGDGDLDAFVANYDGPNKVWINQTIENQGGEKYSHETASIWQQNDKPGSLIEESNSKGYLLENYPDPFSSYTTIRFKVQHSNLTNLRICNIHGKVIKELLNDYAKAGEEYSFTFNGENIPHGVYILYLQSGSHISAKEKMIVVK